MKRLGVVMALAICGYGTGCSDGDGDGFTRVDSGAPPGVREIALTCTPFVRTITDSNGLVTTETNSVVIQDIGVTPRFGTRFTIAACGYQSYGGVPSGTDCPFNSTCTGETPPPNWAYDCLVQQGGTFDDSNRLVFQCGRVSRREAPIFVSGWQYATVTAFVEER